MSWGYRWRMRAEVAAGECARWLRPPGPGTEEPAGQPVGQRAPPTRAARPSTRK